MPVLIKNKENRLAKVSKVYSGSRKSWKNLYRFYSACRQTILFTCKGRMGTSYENGCSNLRRHLVYEYHSTTFHHFTYYAQMHDADARVPVQVRNPSMKSSGGGK